MKINFEIYYDALKVALKAKLPDKVNIDYYSDIINSEIESPAVLIDIDLLDDKPGDEREEDVLPCACTVNLYCVLGCNTKKIQIKLKDFSASVIRIIKNNNFGLGRDVKHPENISAQKSIFSEDANGFDSWVVTFQQTLYLGDDLLIDEDLIPQEIYLGISPEIGPEHIDDYELIGNTLPSK